MSILSYIKSHRTGKAKARRDMDLADMFFEEHKGEPPHDIAKRFFQSLGEDVDVNDSVERDAYAKGISAYENEWMEKLRREVEALQQRQILEMLQEALPGILVAMAPPMTEEQIDAIAKEHGHDTREDECPAIQMLRARLAAEQGE